MSTSLSADRLAALVSALEDGLSIREAARMVKADARTVERAVKANPRLQEACQRGRRAERLGDLIDRVRERLLGVQSMANADPCPDLMDWPAIDAAAAKLETAVAELAKLVGA
jgi:hypothetical protein